MDILTGLHKKFIKISYFLSLKFIGLLLKCAFLYKRPIYKQLALRRKIVKQLSRLDHLSRSSSKKSITFCNIAKIL